MDDHIRIIQQNPSSPGHSLLTERTNPILFEGLLDGLGNGLNLSVGLAAAEEEIIGERGPPFQLKKNRVQGLPLNGRLQTEQGLCFRIGDHILL